ncbi:uncharacterized protein LOC105835266 [Monomorium pharaonis]|uniref:uncharacterized protein LOC105835266 n=1 Tax=Monomorium pharaonis TaxID=307658 RepID=UPI00063F95C0|nr:uncharacterized protein LOC105835266 [Monomorium pharaonis]
MRTAIALCLLTISCNADATFLNILVGQIRNARLDVENTIRQLELLRDNVQQDADLTVMKIWLKQMKEYDNYTISILDKIHKEVEDAKANGKNAQSCYDNALNISRITDYELIAEARLCIYTSTCSIKDNLNFIDNYITAGFELIKELDKIFPDCYEKNSRLIDILKLHNCISTQLRTSKNSVNNLKTDASSAKAISKNAKNVVVDQYTTCLNNAYSTAYSKVEEARSTATKCLN